MQVLCGAPDQVFEECKLKIESTVCLPPPLLIKRIRTPPGTIDLQNVTLSEGQLCTLAAAISQLPKPLLTLHLNAQFSNEVGLRMLESFRVIPQLATSLSTLGLPDVPPRPQISHLLEDTIYLLPCSLTDLHFGSEHPRVNLGVQCLRKFCVAISRISSLRRLCICILCSR